MLVPYLPIAKLAATALARPARHAVHHVVRRVVRPAHAQPAVMAALHPNPAVQCLQKPGELTGPFPTAVSPAAILTELLITMES